MHDGRACRRRRSNFRLMRVDERSMAFPFGPTALLSSAGDRDLYLGDAAGEVVLVPFAVELAAASGGAIAAAFHPRREGFECGSDAGLSNRSESWMRPDH